MLFRRLKEENIVKGTKHHSQKCNLLNNQKLYQPRTCPLRYLIVILFCFRQRGLWRKLLQGDLYMLTAVLYRRYVV